MIPTFRGFVANRHFISATTRTPRTAGCAFQTLRSCTRFCRIAQAKFATTSTAPPTKPAPAQSKPATPKEVVNVVFIDKDGKRTPVKGHAGESILHVAHENSIELEGACEGSLACSTCHVILTPEFYKKLQEPSDEENDMLDLAFALTDTSRLGCQIILRKELEGMTLQLPAATRNMAVDGFKPKPH